jgi:hypothetical protein
MVGANCIILDQIASENDNNLTPLVNYEHKNREQSTQRGSG